MMSPELTPETAIQLKTAPSLGEKLLRTGGGGLQPLGVRLVMRLSVRAAAEFGPACGPTRASVASIRVDPASVAGGAGRPRIQLWLRVDLGNDQGSGKKR